MNSFSPLGALARVETVVTEPSMLTDAECASLREWTIDAIVKGIMRRTPRVPHDYFTPFMLSDGSETPPSRAAARLARNKDVKPADCMPDGFWEIRDRAIKLLGIGSLAEDIRKGSFLNYILPGGDIHPHQDDRVPVDGAELIAIRCNVMYSKPERGGIPFIDGRPLDIPEGGMWAFHASEHPHYASTIHGTVGRGTLSFAFMADPADCAGP